MEERALEVCLECFNAESDGAQPMAYLQRKVGECAICGKTTMRYLLRRACCGAMHEELGSMVRLNPERLEREGNPNLAVFSGPFYRPIRFCPFCGEETSRWDAAYVHQKESAGAAD